MSLKKKVFSGLIFAVLLIVVAGFLGLLSPKSTVYRSTAALQTAISSMLNKQDPGILVKTVACPAKIVDKSPQSITCTLIAADKSSAALTVIETKKALLIAPGQNFASAALTEASLKKLIQGQVKATILGISCPQLILVHSGGSYYCTLTTQPAKPMIVINTFTNAQGAFSYKVIYK